MIDWGAKIRGFCFVAAGFAAALAVVVTVRPSLDMASDV